MLINCKYELKITPFAALKDTAAQLSNISVVKISKSKEVGPRAGRSPKMLVQLQILHKNNATGGLKNTAAYVSNPLQTKSKRRKKNNPQAKQTAVKNGGEIKHCSSSPSTMTWKQSCECSNFFPVPQK